MTRGIPPVSVFSCNVMQEKVDLRDWMHSQYLVQAYCLKFAVINLTEQLSAQPWPWYLASAQQYLSEYNVDTELFKREGWGRRGVLSALFSVGWTRGSRFEVKYAADNKRFSVR